VVTTNFNDLTTTNLAVAIPGTNSPSDGETNNAVAATRKHSHEHESDARLTSAQKHAADQIYGFVKNVQSGAIAGIGMLFVVWAAIRMLSQIEKTFNDIWGVTRGRNWWMSIVLYWTTITLGPLLLVGVVGLTSGPHLQSTQQFLMKMPGIGALVFKLLPLILLWLTFTFFYKAVPNTKVRFSAALIGGFVGGTAWHINNMLAFLYVSRVVTYSKMYGSLALVPIFMLGLYLSWIILLFGAQVAYAYQNRALYLQDRLTENVNQRGREFVALRLMTCIGQRFQRGLPPLNSQEMAEELCIPSRLVQQVLQTLIGAHLVTEVSGGAEAAYTPGRPLEQITAHHLLQAMRARGQELLTRNEPVREEVYGEFARIQEAEKLAASSITMLTLVHRADARLELAPPGGFEKADDALPVLVPAVKPTIPPEPELQASTEVPQPVDASEPEPKPVAEDIQPTPERTEEPVKTHSVAGPVSDEERDFPL
jgi:membrane protein